MAVAYVEQTDIDQDGTAAISHTVSSGSDLYLIVALGFLESASRGVWQVTWNGTAMTALGDIGNSPIHTQLWGIANPDTGTHDVVMSTFGPPNSYGGSIIGYSGVDQTTPTSGGATNTGSSTNPNVTISSATDDRVVSSCITHGGDSISSAQTLRYNIQIGTDTPRSAGADAAGAASVGMSFTSGNWAWACAGINLKAAGGGGGGSLPAPRIITRQSIIRASRW